MRDYIFPPYEALPPVQVMESITALKPGDIMRLEVLTDTGKDLKKRYIARPVAEGTAEERLAAVGLTLEMHGQTLEVVDIGVDSHAEKIGLDIADEHKITGIELPLRQPPKFLFAFPGFLCLGIAFLSQKKRKRKEDTFKLQRSAVFS